MILVDTSLWVHHFRRGSEKLRALLLDGKVLIHPFVIGELACGNIRNRTEILNALNSLPQAVVSEHDEVMKFIERKRLYSRGIGWIDLHLLASTLLSGAKIWTLDKNLHAAAVTLRAAV